MNLFALLFLLDDSVSSAEMEISEELEKSVVVGIEIAIGVRFVL